MTPSKLSKSVVCLLPPTFKSWRVCIHRKARTAANAGLSAWSTRGVCQTPPHGARRVPAVYLAHAFLAFLAVAAVRGMNKLRVCSSSDGSNPTRASKFLAMESIS